ncbi:MAG: DUF58 domain-containing protein [Actinomyces sp.]|nr:DUF58 domain-containing protein [Actinomyces sp.]
MIIPSWRAVALTALGIIPIIFFPTMTLTVAWFLLVVAMVLVDSALALSQRRLEVTRETPSPIRAGTDSVCTLTLANPSGRVVHMDVRDAWPPSVRQDPRRHHVRLEAHGKARLRTAIFPARRGTVFSDFVTVRAWGPLRLGSRQVSLRADLTLTVIPEFRSRRLLPSRLQRLHDLDGSTATVLRGPGTEFDSLREYVIGDDPRDIDWRATARSRDLMVRTWRPERDRHVVIVVDTGRAGSLLLGPTDVEMIRSSDLSVVEEHTHDADVVDVGSAPRLDSGIEATLLLAALADRGGDKVHVMAVDRQVRARVSGLTGPHLLNQLAIDFAGVQPTVEPTDWNKVIVEVGRMVHHHSLLVLVTEVPPLGSDPDFVDSVAALSRNHRVVVASARDPHLDHMLSESDTIDQVYGAAAASAARREIRQACEQLNRIGVMTLDVSAGLLSAKLADLYVQLKGQGLA